MRQIKFGIGHGKSSLQQENTFTSKLVLNIREKLVRCYIWNSSFYGAETCTFWKADQE